jgi:polyisoprenoid-binding protein YceI
MPRIFSILAVFFAVLSAGAFAAAQEEGSQVAEKPQPVPVAIENHVAKISAANTSLEFIGTHVGDDPMPRLGGFRTFEGKITLNDDNSELKSIEVEFDIKSIWTEFDDLTSHLMNADFFEADKYSSATFSSSHILAGDNGIVTVNGELTMHGTTSELCFDCKPEISEKGLLLHGKFTLDRTNFGMDKMTNGVEPAVSIEVRVGLPTSPRPSAPPQPRGGGGKKKGGKQQSDDSSGSDNDVSESMAALNSVPVKLGLPNMT